ncbi:MAG: hypothetical protein Q9168_007286 [Polycauliona sp. 1 TL-2023]
MAAPTSGQPNTFQKRSNVDIIDGDPKNGFPNSIGTDLTLCYDVNFKRCTPKINMVMNSCFTGNSLTLPGKDQWTGFTNDAITSFAITGQTQGKCYLYADTTCQVPVIQESSVNGPVKVPDVWKKYGSAANDKVSSVQCFNL